MQQRCLLLFGPAAFSPFALAHGLPRRAGKACPALPRTAGPTQSLHCPQGKHTFRQTAAEGAHLGGRAFDPAAVPAGLWPSPPAGAPAPLPPDKPEKITPFPTAKSVFSQGAFSGALAAVRGLCPKSSPSQRASPSPGDFPLPGRASLSTGASPPRRASPLHGGFPSTGLLFPGGFPPRETSPPRGEPSLSQREPARPCRLPRPLTWAVRPCGAPAGRRRQRPCPCPCLCRCRRLRRTAAGRATGKTL